MAKITATFRNGRNADGCDGYILHCPGNADGFHRMWMGTTLAEAKAGLAAINERRKLFGLAPL